MRIKKLFSFFIVPLYVALVMVISVFFNDIEIKLLIGYLGLSFTPLLTAIAFAVYDRYNIKEVEVYGKVFAVTKQPDNR
jgi:hypothetical protein